MIRKSALVSFLLVASAAVAFAAARQSMSFELREKTSFGGASLDPGQYKIAWTGSDTVAVEVIQGKKVVASGKGKIVERGEKAADDAVVSRRNGSGMILAEVRFSGKKSVLVLTES
jgi:hypothetical protein